MLAGWLAHRRLRKYKDRGIDGLLRVLASGSMKDRTNVANALWGLADGLAPRDRERAIEALTAAAGDPEPTVRGNAIAALLSLNAPGAIDHGVAALSDPDWFVRTIVTAELGLQNPDPVIVSAVIPLLADPDGFVRQQAAGALGNQGDPRAIPALEQMLQQENRDAEAKRAAKEALAILRAK